MGVNADVWISVEEDAPVPDDFEIAGRVCL